MKKTHIVLLIVIAVSVAAIVGSLSDASTYVNFSEAFETPDREYHVVGQLVKTKELEYNPVENPDLFIFWMKDQNNEERKVHLHKSKPQDFERSEQIVLIGKASGDVFHASEILMKCPSKYNDASRDLTAETGTQ